MAELLFWRPVPSFEPSAEAFAPSIEMVALQRAALADAVAAGQLGPGADSEEAVFLVSTMIAGVLTQAFANEPGVEWGEGRFTPLFPQLMALLPAAFPLAELGRVVRPAPWRGRHVRPARRSRVPGPPRYRRCGRGCPCSDNRGGSRPRWWLRRSSAWA